MMADGIKTSLNERITQFEAFSIALDENTDVSDTAQLAVLFEELTWTSTSQKSY